MLIYIYIYIYIRIHTLQHFFYIYNKYNTHGNIIFFQKDAHGSTDHFASPEMSVRVDLRCKPSIYFLLKIG